MKMVNFLWFMLLNIAQDSDIFKCQVKIRISIYEKNFCFCSIAGIVHSYSTR